MEQHTTAQPQPEPTEPTPQTPPGIDDRDRKIRLLEDALAEAIAELEELDEAA